MGLKLSRHPLWQLCRLDVQIEFFTASFPAQRVSLRVSSCRFGSSEAELQAVLPKSVPTNRASGDAVHRPSHHYRILATGGIFFPDSVRSKTQTLRTRRNMCWCPWSCSSAQTCWTWSRGGGWRTASSSLPHYSRNTSATSRFSHNSRDDKTGNLSGTQPIPRWLDLDSRAECNW